jgi:ubiquinone/menaquinone biosynthesis C-methylase UbiE
MKEVFRVLKRGGTFISEDVSEDDCQELKDVFCRGQGYNEEPLYNKIMKDILDAGFSEIKFLKFEEIEYYNTVDDLKFLLHNTPILGGFDEEKDNEKLNEYINKFTTSKGIKLIRKLYAFTIKK